MIRGAQRVALSALMNEGFRKWWWNGWKRGESVKYEPDKGKKEKKKTKNEESLQVKIEVKQMNGVQISPILISNQCVEIWRRLFLQRHTF